jgi:hypothetical protein
MAAKSEIKATIKDVMNIIGQETKETDDFFHYVTPRDR